jgi:1-acyl-sn-glycerol-3-phosphate acyltransferase
MSVHQAGNFPRYKYSKGVIAGLLLDWLILRRRSFHADAVACIAQIDPPLRVIGAENIPSAGPCVVTVNHYYRAGFSAWWIALAIASVVSQPMHWIMTGELTFPGKWYAPLGMALSKILLSRGARVYGFTKMPPMPPRPRDVKARADSVREVLSVIKTNPNLILGLAPEGGDQPGGCLTLPAPGSGRFDLLLAHAGLKLVPVGAFESGGEFILRFGPAYALSVPPGLTSDQKDRVASQRVMNAIAETLPPHLRGDFA